MYNIQNITGVITKKKLNGYFAWMCVEFYNIVTFFSYNTYIDTGFTIAPIISNTILLESQESTYMDISAPLSTTIPIPEQVIHS